MRIHNAITEEQLVELRQKIAQLPWEPGHKTAGPIAAMVKNNEQLRMGSSGLYATITQAILANETFNAFVRPTQIGVMVSRYSVGSAYGTHVDDGVMGNVRRDVSFTLALSDATDYEGGELVIETDTFTEDSVKLSVRDMIVYPATSLHRVEPVTKGSRLVIVGWARSLFRSHEQREMVFELNVARQALFEKGAATAEINLISKAIANLTRMWATD